MLGFLWIGLISTVGAAVVDWKRDDYFADHTQLVAGVDYGYDLNHGGCNAWLDKYDQCASKGQSPIALPHKPHKVVRTKLATTENFEKTRAVLVTVDGHGLQGYLKNDEDCPIHQGVYKAEHVQWKLYKFRLVFGADSSKGAEHSYRGRKYAAELQFYSYNTKYGSPEEAGKHENGIMVYADLLKVQKHDDPDIEALFDSAKKLQGVDAFVMHTSLATLGKAIEKNSYNLYKGSFTFPPCSRKILWAIFANPGGISERQLEILRGITSVSGEKVPCNNQRPIQPLNNRKVYLVNQELHDHRHLDLDESSFERMTLQPKKSSMRKFQSEKSSTRRLVTGDFSSRFEDHFDVAGHSFRGDEDIFHGSRSLVSDHGLGRGSINLGHRDDDTLSVVHEGKRFGRRVLTSDDYDGTHPVIEHGGQSFERLHGVSPLASHRARHQYLNEPLERVHDIVMHGSKRFGISGASTGSVLSNKVFISDDDDLYLDH